MEHADFPRVFLSRHALLLDVDGTLIDIAPTPNEVHVPHSLCRALSSIREQSGGALALVSGRRIEDLDSLFSPLKFAAVGAHGAELRPAADSAIQHHAPLDSDVKHLIARLGTIDPRIRVEDKGTSIALHYRLVPEVEATLERQVAEVLEKLGHRHLMALRGKAVLEVKPRDFDKGSGVKRLMDISPFKGRSPIFLGDDVTDEDVFAVLPQFDGLGISVGRPIPGAKWTMSGPQRVRDWLTMLAGTEPNG